MSHDEISQLLDDRGKVHGPWDFNANTFWHLKAVMRSGLDRRQRMDMPTLTPGQEESLCAILGKIARIIAGDPNHMDHWRDIAGYAGLEMRAPVKVERHSTRVMPRMPEKDERYTVHVVEEDGA